MKQQSDSLLELVPRSSSDDGDVSEPFQFLMTKIKYLESKGSQFRPDVVEYFRIQDLMRHAYEAKLGYQFSKRLFDKVAAALLVALLSPVLVLIGIAIKLSSPGPILYSQLRVGQYGTLFTIYKFRTMRVGADADLGVTYLNTKVLVDSRVTAVGRLLRNFKFDELPQLLNVLTGQMSLVGPRPHGPDEIAMQEKMLWSRLSVPPGLTGLWQATLPNSVDGHRKLRRDMVYLRKRSFALDLWILFKTFRVVALGERLLESTYKKSKTSRLAA